MKVVWAALALAVTLAGIGIACGPQQKYCYAEHKTCQEVMDDMNKPMQLDAQMDTQDDGGPILGQDDGGP